MNRVRTALLLVAALCGVIAAGTAYSHGHRHRAHVGIWFGAPVFPYYYYPYPRYYYPPTVVVPAPVYPPTYIEQNPPAAAPSAPSSQGSAAYWYYCQDSQTYYPYVQQCASPWQQVVPQTAPPS